MSRGVMKSSRRTFLQFAAAGCALPVFSRVATAQTYPIRPITMIVTFAAGGLADVVGRVFAKRMSESLRQPIIIENVSGADGSIGTGRAARARPDGYTIDLGTMDTHVLSDAFYSLQYDVLNDFVPISLLVSAPFVLFARRTMPGNDLNELLAWLKANPNRASAGFSAGSSHLLTAFLKKQTGTQFTLVPYRGSAPRTQDLVAGQLDLSFQPPDALSLVRAGSIKAYAVTSDTRLTLAPDIPTFVEMGLPALSFSDWMGFSRPGARQGISSGNSMLRPWKQWPIRRYVRGSLTSGSKFSRASSRHRRR
jgi:tripartite-type tricarboxylate transporter receptor subunit TctC